jgi:hypothetical protein
MVQVFYFNWIAIRSDYGLDGLGSIPDRGGGFFFYPLRPASSEAHPTSCTMANSDSFPANERRPGRDADHSPHSSAEVKKE